MPLRALGSVPVLPIAAGGQSMWALTCVGCMIHLSHGLLLPIQMRFQGKFNARLKRTARLFRLRLRNLSLLNLPIQYLNPIQHPSLRNLSLRNLLLQYLDLLDLSVSQQPFLIRLQLNRRFITTQGRMLPSARNILATTDPCIATIHGWMCTFGASLVAVEFLF
jgi:hypothetical protein